VEKGKTTILLIFDSFSTPFKAGAKRKFTHPRFLFLSPALKGGKRKNNLFLNFPLPRVGAKRKFRWGLTKI